MAASDVWLAPLRILVLELEGASPGARAVGEKIKERCTQHPVVAIVDSLIVCGEKNEKHLHDEDAGKLDGAVVLFIVFILFLLSLNCFNSPVIFLGCHSYKSLKII